MMSPLRLRIANSAGQKTCLGNVVEVPGLRKFGLEVQHLGPGGENDFLDDAFGRVVDDLDLVAANYEQVSVMALRELLV